MVVGGAIAGAVVGGYVLTVLFLYRFPGLLHRKKKNIINGFLIAHRGGAGEYLENTMGAFKHSVNDCGADVLELDLHLTKDGKVVVSHDGELERCTGQKVTIEDTNYDDLPCLLQHLNVTFDGGSYVEQDCPDNRIPLFTDLLKNFPNVGMNIDLKHGNQELVNKVGKLIQQYERQSHTIWGGVSPRTMEMCYNFDRSIPIYFSIPRAITIVVLYWTGLLAFLPIRESYFEMPYFKYISQQMSYTPPRGMRIGMAIFEFLALNRFLIKYLERRGIPTWLFVLNTEESWHKAYQLGCVGIHTDYPSKLRQFLTDNPQYVSTAECTGLLKETS